MTPVRGAGQPQGVFVMERLLDRVARELELDRAEVRRRNLDRRRSRCLTPRRSRPAAACRWCSTAATIRPASAIALERAGWDDFPARQAAARARGPLSRHRPRQLRRGHRPRAVRAGDRAHRAVGQGACLFRRRRDGPEHQDHAGADRRRAARRATWSNVTVTTGDTRGDRARARRLQQPAGGDRRLLRASRGAARCARRRCKIAAHLLEASRAGSGDRRRRDPRQGRARPEGRASARSRAPSRARRALRCRAASRPGLEATEHVVDRRHDLCQRQRRSSRSRSISRPAR